MLSADVLIETEVGKVAHVAQAITKVDGVQPTVGLRVGGSESLHGDDAAQHLMGGVAARLGMDGQ